MLFLVFADGNFVGFLDEDVDSHECRVGEKAGIDAFVGFAADNLFFNVVAVAFDAKGFARFVFE